MKIRLVTVEPWGGTGTKSTVIWSGQLSRHHGGDFEIDIPRELRLAVLSEDKQLRIEVVPE